MNIAILNYHRIGGSGIVAYEIGRAMAEERGHNVHFIGLEPPFRLRNSFSEKIRFHRVCINNYPVFDYQPYSLALASQVSELIDRFKIDVIHSHYALPHAISAHLAREISGRDVKCITTLHGTDITIVGSHPSMKNITNYAINKSDAVTAVSDFLKRETESQFSVLPGHIRTIYNFVNPDIFNPDVEKVCCLDNSGKYIIVHVSNLRPVKAPLDVIKIFNGLKKRVKRDCELWIIGEGPLQSEMITLAEEYGIEKSVRFMGICNDVASFLASSDLMILPSLHESFGLAALEAMACGVPVAASRAGGLPEVIDDGGNGILFEVGNIDEAVDKASVLLNDEDNYSRVRMNVLKTAAEKFSMDKIIKQYEELYTG